MILFVGVVEVQWKPSCNKQQLKTPFFLLLFFKLKKGAYPENLDVEFCHNK